MSLVSAIYTGHVIHKRLRPKPHALDYRVFSLFVDLDDLTAADKRLTFFSHNRFNLISLYDKDYGPGDGTGLKAGVFQTLKRSGLPFENRSIALLTYPRVLGYTFNPLSVFYVYDPQGKLESLVYEVSNTFGERTAYALAAGECREGQVYAQACTKDMYVSPFADPKGGYKFRITDPAGEALVAVLFSDRGGALLKTHFRGTKRPFTDGSLLRQFVSTPLMTMKVMAAIHWEALKLWLKGVPLTERTPDPAKNLTVLHDNASGSNTGLR